MIKPEVLDALVAAGCTAEQLAAAVKADQARSSGAERQARYRARKASQSYERDVTSVTVTDDLSPKKAVSPRPPLEKTTPNRDRETRDRQFDQLWTVYPRKTGKAPARKAFDAALKVADFPTILAGAERYAADRAGKDSQFTKHPQTWFHGLHWQDEPEPPRATPPPRSTAAPPPRNAGELSRLQLINGTAPHEPPNPDPGRVEAGDRHRQAEGTGITRRFAVPSNQFGRI